jgi:hydrogenase maturation factor
VVGTLIGEVSQEQLITPRGALPGDRLLLSKGVPIEATALLAREFPERLRQAGGLSEVEIKQAQAFLYDPGISVAREAMLATQAGVVHAMHDPTEGGLYTALWELVEACGYSLLVNPARVPVPELSASICRILGLDPLAAIASGALLMVVPAGEVQKISAALQSAGIRCAEIGQILEQPGLPTAWQQGTDKRLVLPRPERDAVAALYED